MSTPPSLVRARQLTLLLGAVLLAQGAAMPAVAHAPTVAATVTTVGSSPAAVGAAKKLARPKPRVIPGDRTVTVRWAPVKRATRYTVQVSRSSSFRGKSLRSTTTRSTEVVVRGLARNATHYVRVRATKPTTSAWSATRKARTTTASAGRQRATASPAGTHKVKVSWPRIARGTSVTIIGSYTNVNMGSRATSFTIRNIPVTRTSHVVTIPESFRSRVGSASGNPVFIRVIVHNGVRSNIAPMVISWATPAPVTGPASNGVSFATYNVAHPEATQHLSGQSWMDRRGRVARTIRYAKADVVGVQEATGTRSGTPDGVRHYADVAGLVHADGYRLTLSQDAIDSTPANGGTKGAHLLVQTSRVEVLDAGLVSLRAQAERFAPKVAWTSKDRFFSWALLRSKATGAQFYAVSVHLEQGTAASTQKMRLAATAGLVGYMAAEQKSANKAGLPLVILGDLNSHVEWYPNGPQTSLVAQGFTSAASSKARSGVIWSSFNHREGDGFHGFRPAPFKNTFVGQRIDHIFVRGAAGVRSYTNQAVLRKGLFDTSYLGSDHNLQHAVVQIPR